MVAVSLSDEGTFVGAGVAVAVPVGSAVGWGAGVTSPAAGVGVASFAGSPVGVGVASTIFSPFSI